MVPRFFEDLRETMPRPIPSPSASQSHTVEFSVILVTMSMRHSFMAVSRYLAPFLWRADILRRGLSISSEVSIPINNKHFSDVA